ncbi:hypothetical protein SAMN04488137_0794 [Fictibacillus solisalsi]|uniref:Uncharacterized protein n=1 Tax=Fictibacillus solisalsi TaxID=459525 RepID=A0A1G9U9X9_9BACL|nr:hypothetical protein [Fictibacillus solisalsi]SDM56623.1 hypothetical protein SAMN04488137_0794 [Fictibacillus solisalsi]
MDNDKKQKELLNRNDRNNAFEKNQEKQLERDQLVMPTDDLPLEDIKDENAEERNKEETKSTSSSEKKLNPPEGNR